MSADFWWGVLAIPAGALALAVIASAVLLVVAAYGRWDGELWFRRGRTGPRVNDRQATIAGYIASDRKSYFFRLIPGWRVVFSRYDYIEQMSDDDLALCRRVNRAIVDAREKFIAEENARREDSEWPI